MKEYIKPLAEVVEFEPKDNILADSGLSTGGDDGVEIW